MSLIRSYTISGGSNELVYYSEDYGLTWSSISQVGIPSFPNVTCVAVDPYNPLVLLAGLQSGGGIYKSTDGGSTFSLIPGTTGASYFDIKFIDSLKVIAVGSTISLSSNGGNSFTTYLTTPTSVYGSTISSPFENLYIETPSDIYVSVWDKAFKSTDGGINWIPLNGNLPIVATKRIEAITANSVFVNLSIDTEGIFYSSDNGQSFTLSLANTGSNNALVALNASTLFAFMKTGSSLHKSTNDGLSWTLVSSGIGTSVAGEILLHVYDLNRIVVISQFAAYSPNYALLYSIDGGVNFQLSLSGVLRVRAYGTANTLECSECPPKFSFNNQTDYCDYAIVGNPLCELGYYYDGSGLVPRCISEVDPLDFYEIDGCPSYCTVLTDSDVRGTCECLQQLTVFPCCYRLVDCKGLATSIITQMDLSTYFEDNSIIKIQGSDVCWEIEKLDSICLESQDIVVTQVFTSCLTCNPSYALYNCKDNSAVIYTVQDFSQYLGAVVSILEYENECWIVGNNTNEDFVPLVLTVDEVFKTCDECNPPIYQLNNCFAEGSFILTDDQLKTLLGKTISVVGYPGLCFSITEPTCKCLTIEFVIDGNISETNATASENLINGRNTYVFGFGPNNYAIAWSIAETRWELYNADTNTLIAYSPIDLDCIYTNFWVILSEIDNVVTRSCSGVLYNIVVDKEFDDCECCTSKNCK